MVFFTIIDGRTYEIQVNRKRMKRVRLKIFPTMEIKLSVPYDTPDEWIIDFLKKKQPWLEERASIFKSTRAIEKEEHIVSGTATRILGRQITIQVIQSDHNHVEKDDQHLFIYTVDLNQTVVDDQFDKWWQKQAKVYFQTVLDRQYPIIRNHGISKPAIFVRKMKTLWGSCGRKSDRINLNYYLYKAPVPCIEYIVFHELAHFVYPHHNKDFYDFITIYMPDWMERMKMLDYEIVAGI